MGGETVSPDFTEEQRLSVVVCFSEGPSRFWLQLTERASNLKEMTQRMNKTYGVLEEEDIALSNPAVGSLCCARYSGDPDSWYRAKVLENTNEGTLVQFIDYGNSEIVECCVQLLSKYSKLPAFAYEACLFGCDKSSPAFLSAEFDNSIMDGGGQWHAVIKAISKSILSVELENDCGQRLTGQQAGQENHQAAGRSDVPPCPIEYNRKYEVFVCYIQSFNSFYCQLVTFAEQFNALCETIAVSSSPSLTSGVVEGQLYLACSADDGCWYRSRILSVAQDACQVKFIDYGNEEVVATSELCEIPAELCALPAQGIHCSLMCNREPSAEAVEAFNSLSPKQQLVAEFGPTGENGAYVTRLCKNDVDIVLHLMGNGSCESDSVLALSKDTTEGTINDCKGVATAASKQAALIAVGSQLVADVQAGSHRPVVVSHANSPGDFFLQLSELSEDLEALMQQIASAYPISADGHSFSVGSICCAQFNEDGCFYRAQVKAIRGSSATVVFIDYGNEQEQALGDLLPLPGMFLRLPPAVRCRLYNLHPLGCEAWSAASQEIFHELTVDQELKALFVSCEESVWNVRLFQPSGQEVGLALEGRGVARSIAATAESVKSGFRATESYSPVHLSSSSSVMITHIDSPTVFYCQPTLQADQLLELSEQLAEVYDSGLAVGCELDLATVQPGMPCCARYSVDGAWYRTTVLHHTAEEVTVHFVDYGNSETVAAGEVFLLAEKFGELPSQAVACSLAKIQPANGAGWSETALSIVSEMLLGQVRAVGPLETRGNTYICNFPDVIDRLVKEGLACDTSKPASIFKSPVEQTAATPAVQPSPAMPAAADKASPEPKMLCLTWPLKSSQSVTVSHAISPAEFWCQPNNGSVGLRNLLHDMNKFYKGVSKPLPGPTSRVHCAAFLSNSWCRAAITEVNGNMAEVRNIDTGKSESVPFTSLQMLARYYYSVLPAQAVKCSLHGVDLANGHWSAEVNKEFEQLVKSRSVVLNIMAGSVVYGVQVAVGNDVGNIGSRFGANSSSGRASTTGGVTTSIGAKSYQHMNGIQQPRSSAASFSPSQQPRPSQESFAPLCGQGSTSSLKIASATLTLGTSYAVEVSSTTGPRLFWCQLRDFVPAVQELSEVELPGWISQTMLLTSLPPVGSVCAALFSADELWYRARVIEHGKGGVKVFFVDYGNTEVVPVANLRCLNEKLCQLCEQAIPCILKGTDLWTEDDFAMFTSLVKDRSLSLRVLELTAGSAASPFVVQLVDSSRAPPLDIAELVESQ